MASSEDGASGPGGRGQGWILFAGWLLAISGVFKLFDAFWAFEYNEALSEEVQTILFQNDLTSWGWLWLVTALILVAARVCRGHRRPVGTVGRHPRRKRFGTT